MSGGVTGTHVLNESGKIGDDNARDLAILQRGVFVDHGSTAGTARPSSSVPVKWFGTVAPTNAITNDEWYDRSAEILKRYDGSAWQSAGSATYAPISTTLTQASAAGTYAPRYYPSSLAANQAVLGNAYNPVGQWYGRWDTGLSRYHAAKARARAGGGTCRVLCAGDSLTLGYNGTLPYETNSWPARVRTILAERGVTTYEGETFFTQPIDGVAANNSDSRMVFGTGWNFNAGQYGIGGQALLQSPAPGSAATFDFGAVTCDTFRVYYLDITAVFNFAIDGGSYSAASFTPTGSLAVRHVDIPAGSTGSHTLHIKTHATAGTTYLLGVGYFTAANATGGITIMRAGQPNTTTTLWVGSNSLNAIDNVAPDLAILMLGTNDRSPGAGVSTTDYLSNLETLISRFSGVNGDTLLVLPPPSAGTLATNQTYNAAVFAAADALGSPVLDLSSRWPQTTATAMAAPYSLLGGDGIHPTDKGYWDIAVAMADALLAA